MYELITQDQKWSLGRLLHPGMIHLDPVCESNCWTEGQIDEVPMGLVLPLLILVVCFLHSCQE